MLSLEKRLRSQISNSKFLIGKLEYKEQNKPQTSRNKKEDQEKSRSQRHKKKKRERKIEKNQTENRVLKRSKKSTNFQQD